MISECGNDRKRVNCSLMTEGNGRAGRGEGSTGKPALMGGGGETDESNEVKGR